ncbi:hypothetical protein FOVG_14357 [Fusarium oxysporum f. sp. pisi HDV247]|uniref:Uncharacterized protein n=1 Tax=Fusarium oxysporum f. sp. pisi HDV247 TaxID=1080344 RepID=W9NNN1_FUSOX|nr:hypothetical protein FOVG_14357 [Fusarium oxysporum f. sp. pisi HDV247]
MGHLVEVTLVCFRCRMLYWSEVGYPPMSSGEGT